MSVAVSMEWDGLHETLERIAAIGLKPEKLLAAIGNPLEDSTRARFDSGRDPDGVSWESYAPLNPLYAAVEKKGVGILVESGKLRGSIRSVVVGSELLVGSDEIYAPVHQFGAVIQPKNGRHLSFIMGGHLWHVDSVLIEARPYLGLSDEDVLMIMEELEAVFDRALGGGGGV
ncbi:phage virion morphogenesis protein [Acetobacter fabarum]|uniref:phage virion morphogenesis protein n=1 Tax=Acetobacter fabarum TaxID=483199 RepID=UPI00312B8724